MCQRIVTAMGRQYNCVWESLVNPPALEAGERWVVANHADQNSMLVSSNGRASASNPDNVCSIHTASAIPRKPSVDPWRYSKSRKRVKVTRWSFHKIPSSLFTANGSPILIQQWGISASGNTLPLHGRVIGSIPISSTK